MKNPFNTMRPQARFFLSAAFIMLGIAALMWFAFFFLLNRIRIESSEIEAAKIRRASLETRRNEAKREEVAFTELQADIGRVESAFVEQPLPLFEFLENLAFRDNLAVALALEGQTADEKPERLRITISGAYKNLLRFVRGIELSPYETDIQAIVLQMTDQRPAFSDSLARFIIDLNIVSP